MVKTEFINLYEELDHLWEKWEIFSAGWGPTKIWHSDSVSEFRSFLQNAANNGIKGLRLSITDGLYLAGRASDVTHDNLVALAVKNYIAERSTKFEWSTCGFPNLKAFEQDNIEQDFFDDYDYDNYEEDGEDVMDPETGEILWEFDGKIHQLVADCGTFEVALYNFHSEQFPQFKYGDGRYFKQYKLFESSETYFALKPLIKKLYMTNM
jgi:hypothetical protein